MVKPPDKLKLRHCFKLKVEQCFYIEGTSLNTVTKVHLVESTANFVWDPELVTKFEEQTPTCLRFVSTPKLRDESKKPNRPTGTLTITVTNPDGDSSTDASSTYE